MAGKKYLLDTNCLIWFQENNPKIPHRILDLITDTTNTIYFSQISLFEIAIKLKIGKLPGFTATTDDLYQSAILDGFEFMSINNKHIHNYQNLPLLNDHRDPFDRLLIATAMVENAIILSADKHFTNYRDMVSVLW